MRAGDVTTVQELSDLVAEFVDEREWQRYHRPKDIAIALIGEAAELLELWQWTGPMLGVGSKGVGSIDGVPYVPPSLHRIEQELADVVIYAHSMANACGIDLARAVLDKLEKNAEKYPAPEKGENCEL
jgi:dCTP diphosphatase